MADKKCVCISCFGAYNTRLKRLIPFLESKGYDVTYITSDFSHTSKEYYTGDASNCELIHVKKYKRNISPARLLSHWQFSTTVKKKLEDIKPDLVYSFLPPNSLVYQLSRYKRVHGFKWAVEVYDMWPESFPAGKIGKLLKLPFKVWANLRDKHITDADLIVTLSESGIEDWHNRTNNAVPVVMMRPNIDMENLPKYETDLQNEISFCYLGNVNHITDIELCRQFLGEIARSKKVTLHIIGEGQNKQELLDAMNAIGVETVSHGIVLDAEAKKSIYSHCDFGLNIPKEEIGAGMALKFVEYTGVGLPSVNSAPDPSKAIVEKYGSGINISRNDISAAAEKILNIDKSAWMRLHESTLKAYEEEFANPNFEEAFNNLLS